jgi:predicted nucleic acid-binding protein
LASADVSRFLRDLAQYETVALDTNVLIYHLEGLIPYVDLTRATFTALAEGDLSAVISTLTVAELLVGPYREKGDAKVGLAREFVSEVPGGTLAEVTFDVADRAAWLRTHGLRTPDAIILATAVVHGCDAVLTNDPALRRSIPGVPPVLLLDDYC